MKTRTEAQVSSQVHAENGDGVLRAQQKTIAAGITGPEGHYISRPDFLEVCNFSPTEAPSKLFLLTGEFCYKASRILPALT